MSNGKNGASGIHGSDPMHSCGIIYYLAVKSVASRLKKGGRPRVGTDLLFFREFPFRGSCWFFKFASTTISDG